MTLVPENISTVILREQNLGEARAYQICAEAPQETYEELVLKVQAKQDE